MLIVGYSWVNSHLDPPGNPGVGVNVAWRRIVLVLIGGYDSVLTGPWLTELQFSGSVAALILMILPPQSRRRDVRLSNARSLEELSSLYAVLISRWLADLEQPNPKPAAADGIEDEADAQAGPTTASDQNVALEADDDLASIRSFSTWTPVFRSRLIKVSAQLKALQGATEDAKWEGSVRGEWPYEKYARLVALQSAMLGNLVQLLSSLGALNPAWRRTLLQKTPVLNPNLVSRGRQFVSAQEAPRRVGPCG